MAERRESEPLLSPSTGSDSEQISLTPAEGTTSLPDRSAAGDRKVQDLLLVLNQDDNTGELSKEAIELLRATPDNYIPVAHQIGGHKYINGKPGLIQKIGEPQYILKSLQPYPKGSRELNFYEFFQGKDLTEDVKELKKFLPKYYGVRTIPQTTGGDSDPKPNYICLEDCIYPFKKSSILDLKLGKREIENVADKAKLLRAKNKYPAQEVIGFRIQGMRIYKVESDSFIFYDKSYGISLLDDKQVQQGLLNFLDNGTQVRHDILPSIIEKISEIRDWFAKQTTYKLFASSILLIYEGSQAPDVDSSRVDCRIVDFAHAFFSSELDDPGADCLYGADRVLHHLKQIQEMQ